jgi:hypothetical protein
MGEGLEQNLGGGWGSSEEWKDILEGRRVVLG